MTGPAVTVVASGGLAVTDTVNGVPVTQVESGGMAITLVDSGGLPLHINQGGGAAPLSFPINLTVNNAGAEAGDASGWTAASGGVLWTSINTTSVGYPPSIYEGSRYFSAGNNANARMYQDIDVSAYASTIDAGGAVAELSARFSTNDSLYDYFSVFLRALDASSSVISSVAQEDLFVQELSLGWYLQDLNMLLPSGTRKVRIEIHATRASGTDNDVYFDDIKLSLQDSSRRITPTYGASVSRGSRTGLITLSTTNLVGFGTLSSMVDGSNSNSWYFNGATNDGTNWITFDFGSGAALVIDEFVWKQQNTVTHGVWRLEGSNDNSSWTQIGSDFTLRNGVNRPGGTSNTGYRYYRLRAMSGSRSASPYLYEIQFRAK